MTKFVERLNRSTSNSLFYIIIFLASFIPLFITPRITGDAFALPKFFLLALLIAVLFIIIGAQIVVSGRLKKISLLLFVLMFTLITLAAISSGQSVNVNATLLGNYGRYNGLISLICFGFLAGLSGQLEWDKRRLTILLKAIVISATLVSVYGLFQFLGYDFTHWQSGFELNRSFSTFGNPSLLSVYLSFVWPLSLALWVGSTARSERMIWLSAAGIIGLAIITSFTRGGWLAAVVSLTALVFLTIKSKKLLVKRAVMLAFILLFMVMVMVVVTSKSSSNTTNVIVRALSSTKIGAGSMASRVEIWRSAAKIIYYNPLLGVGPDNFGFSYPHYESLASAQSLVISDDAHSLPLQFAATLGIPATLIYYLIIITVLYKTARFSFNSDAGMDSVLMSGIFSAFIGFMVASLVTVVIQPAALLPWLFIGIVSGALTGKEEIAPSIAVRATLVATFLLTAIVITILSVRFFLGDINYLKAEQNYKRGDYENAVTFYSQAYSYNPLVNEYQQGWAKAYGQLYFLNPRNFSLWQSEVDIYLLAFKNNPLYLANYWHLANAYLSAFQTYGELKYLLAADSILKKVLPLRPYSYTTHHLLGKTYLELGQANKAIAELCQANAINSNQSNNYLLLEEAYNKANMPDQAKQAADMIIKLRRLRD